MDSEVKKHGRKPRQPKEPVIQESKISEVRIETEVQELLKEEPERNPNEYLVFINGKERYLSKSAIEVALKDDKRTVELPENSPLAEPALPEPCQNCG